MHPALGNRDLGEHAALRLRGLLQVGVILDQHVGDDDVRAHACESERILAAKPAGGAGDDCNASRKIKHAQPLNLMVPRWPVSAREMTRRWISAVPSQI